MEPSYIGQEGFVSSVGVSGLNPVRSKWICGQQSDESIRCWFDFTAKKSCRLVHQNAVRMDVSGDDQGELLVHSAMIGNLSEVKRLLDTGVSANFSSSFGNSGMTPLMWACSEGYVDIVKALLDAGADAQQATSNGRTAVMYCFENMPPARAGIAPPAGFPGDSSRPTPAQVPMVKRETGHVGVAKLLLVRGINADIKNEFGEGLLHMAARKGQLEMVDLLLSVCNVDVDALSKGYRHSPLHIASMEGFEKVIARLIEAGANTDAQNVLGWTPLMWAAARGHVEAVRVLLKANADPNLKGEETGRPGERTTSALKEARKGFSSSEISNMLVKAGAKE